MPAVEIPSPQLIVAVNPLAKSLTLVSVKVAMMVLAANATCSVADANTTCSTSGDNTVKEIL